jgi:hypothetical protein
MNTRKSIRVWTYVPPTLNEQLSEWADRLGITKSVLISLSTSAGLAAIIRTIAPQEAFTPEQLAEIGRVAKENEAVLLGGKK